MFPFHLHIKSDKDLILFVSLKNEGGITFEGTPSKKLTDQIKRFLKHYPNAPRPPLKWDLLTPFTSRVLEEVALIPCGSVQTYGEIAQKIGSPKAARAVGGACGRNPFPIFIPCHRVVSPKGLGGFLYGLEHKENILIYEKNLIYQN